MRLGRVVVPAIDEMSHDVAGQTRLRNWTRVLTIGLSLVQSYGVRASQSVPGAANAGIGFIAQTMAVLTAGAIVAMALSEQISRIDNDDPVDPPDDGRLLASGESAPVHVRTGEALRAPLNGDAGPSP